jgi:hypothetical protein
MIIIIVWLCFYYSYYPAISKVVGAVWAALLSFLSYMKIKKAKKKSLPEFLRLLPVKMIIITYTLLILFFAWIFLFVEFPVHTLSIRTSLNNEPQSGVIVKLNNTQYKTDQNGSLEIQSIKSGSYTIISELEGYTRDTSTVNILWYKKKIQHEIPFDRTKVIQHPTLPGKIHIVSKFRNDAFNNAEIFIRGKKQNKKTPATIDNLKPGSYFIKLTKIVDNYIYEGEKEVIVKADKTTRAEVELVPTGEVSKLMIFSEPGGASVYVNGIPRGTTDTGTKRTVVELSVGTYLIRLEKNGYRTTDKEVIIDELNESVRISMDNE